jgi:hypothetical protein
MNPADFFSNLSLLLIGATYEGVALFTLTRVVGMARAEVPSWRHVHYYRKRLSYRLVSHL